MHTCVTTCKTSIHLCTCMHVHTHTHTHTLRSPSPSHQGQTTAAAFQLATPSSLTLTSFRAVGVGVPDFAGDKEPAEVTRLTVAGLQPRSPAHRVCGHTAGATGVRTTSACRPMGPARPQHTPIIPAEQEPLSLLRVAEPGHCRDYPEWWGVSVTGSTSAQAGSREGQFQGSSGYGAPA